MLTVIEEVVMPRNSGRAFIVRKGQLIRVWGKTVCDFVAFNLNNLRERFDQARTKANQNTIYVTTGHALYSKFNNKMLTIVEDTFVEGHHDLQKGMCSRFRHELAFREGRMDVQYLHTPLWEDLPDHGCWENLEAALAPWGIPKEDIPSPFNIFQHMEIDATTGLLRNTRVRPTNGAHVTMRAEMDCLVGVSACPDITVGGRELKVSILEGAPEPVEY